jgi:hypothetical protein
MISLYIDNLIILVPKEHLRIIAGIKNKLSLYFKIKQLSTIKQVLSIRIQRSRGKRRVYLDQQAYIEKLLHEFTIENPTVKTTAILISDANSLHCLQDNKELSEIRDYQRKISSIMFTIVYLRPNICFTMSKLS